ncbi:AzlC family ABC transporter permease [Oerskovia sp. M15]
MATGLYGVSYGALAVVAGLDVLQTMVLSMLMFSGGSQFALIGIVASGGTSGAAIATAGLLGVRNGLYGVQLSPLLAAHGWRRVVAAQVTIDESTAVATAQRRRPRSVPASGGPASACSSSGTCSRSSGRSRGRDGRSQGLGLDAAAGAAFLALLWPRLASRIMQLTAASAVVMAVVLIPLVPPGVPVLAAGPWRSSSGALPPTTTTDHDRRRRARPAAGRTDGRPRCVRDDRRSPRPGRAAARRGALMSDTTLWVTLIVASLVCFGLKLAGHLVPEHWLASERISRTAALVTAALLAALVTVQTVGDGQGITLDARLPALGVAAVALALRARSCSSSSWRQRRPRAAGARAP